MLELIDEHVQPCSTWNNSLQGGIKIHPPCYPKLRQADPSSAAAALGARFFLLAIISVA